MEHNHGGLVQIISFLFMGNGWRFQPLIFQGDGCMAQILIVGSVGFFSFCPASGEKNKTWEETHNFHQLEKRALIVVV